jgi:very-short-patch-repair endonuclease
MICFQRLREAESIGRPFGDDRFLARIERLTARQHAHSKYAAIRDQSLVGQRYRVLRFRNNVVSENIEDVYCS